MATPNADRLHGIEEWRTSSIEHALDLFSSVTEELAEVADINREVSSDLGLEGGTADAACRILRTIAADMDENADSLTQIVNVSRDALQAGIQAKYESQAIQQRLRVINSTFGKTNNTGAKGIGAQSNPEMVAYIEAQRDAAHAEIEKRATKTLTTLNGRALTAIGGLPFQDQIRAMLGRDNPGLAQRLRQHMEFGRTAPADNGRPPAPPTRSATDWRVSPDRSLGSPGSHTGHTPDTNGGGGSVGGGVSLQGAHYSPGRSAVVVPGSPTPHAAPTGGTGHGGHDPLLGLGLGGGAALGAGVAGFRAYQAARAARAAEAPASRAGSLRSGATIRSTPPASGSVLRGTNTARTPASPTASTASRGGAARPVSSSSSSSSGSGKLLRGATTAQRAAAPKTPSRGPGMLKGAVTAPRKPTGSTEPVGKPGRAQTEPAGSRTTGTNSRGASSTRGAGSKTANASRGAASTATTGNTRGTGSKTASAKTAARGAKGAGSTGRTGAARAGAGRSGASSLAARPQTGKVSQQVRDGSTSQALHSLGRRTRDTDRKKRDQAGGTDVTAYETDNTVTFLEAGHRTTNDDEDTAR